jgi:predicted nucleic acid-binding protein
MIGVFLDTGYLVALLSPRDDFHDRTVEVEELLADTPLITSDLVLTELLNFFSDKGANLEERAYLRDQAVQVVHGLQNDAQVVIVEQTPDLFDAALTRYAERPDKGYSLVDCCSMIIMERRGLLEVATADHHFVQAGFVILIDTASENS